jgi:hypothetical protein
MPCELGTLYLEGLIGSDCQWTTWESTEGCDEWKAIRPILYDFR